MSLVNTRTAKPLPGVRVNTTHPYAQGLVAAYLFNESSGIRSYEVLEPEINVLEGESPPKDFHTNIRGAYGNYAADLGYLVAGKYATGTDKNLPSASATQPFTVVWRVIRSNSSNTCDWMYGTSGTIGAMLAARMTGSTSISFLGWGADVSVNTIQTASVLDKWQTFAITWDGTTIRIYQNGQLLGSGAVTLSTIKTGTLRFSVDTFNSGVTSVIGLDYWYAYNKALTPEVLKNMATDPFAIFKTKLANYWVGVLQNVTTTKTLTGKARIQITTTKNLTGKARIQKATTQNLTAKSRISIVTTKTLTGKARITNSTSQTLTGKSNIRVTTIKTITGKANIINGVQKTLTGKSRIRITTTQNLAGKASIATTTTKNLTAKGRIRITSSQALTGLARITITTTQTIGGRGRIETLVNQTITAKARIFHQTTPIDLHRVFVVVVEPGKFKVLDDIDRTFAVVTDPRVFKVIQ